MLSEIKKAVLLFIIGAYAAPNPAPDILSFCCDAKRKNIGQERKTRYITALLCSARPNGCR